MSLVRFNIPVARYLAFREQQRMQHQARVTTAESNTNKWEHARPFAEIPRLKYFDIFKSFFLGSEQNKKDPLDMLLALKETHGDLSIVPPLFGKPLIVITHNPKDFETILRNEGVWPIRPGSETTNYHRSVHRADFFQGVEGLVSTQDEKWGSFRSVVNPVLMQPRIIKLYLDKMSQVNWQFIELIKRLRDPQTLEVPANFEEDINRWTLESVSVVALDKQLGLLTHNRDDPQVKHLFSNLNTFFELSYQFEFLPSIWKYVKTSKFKRLMQTMDNIQSITSIYVNEAVDRLEQTTNDKPEHEKSVLEKLLKIDKKVATVMAMDLLMAGVDTTTTTFVGIMLYLAKNPEKQAKLRRELIQILPQKNSEFTEKSLYNVPYLKACIKEGLRLYPLGAGNGRVVQNDVVLSGYRVPKGTLTSLIWATLLKDEKYYPRPNEFLPERWLRSSPNKKLSAATDNMCSNVLRKDNPFVYLPFGFGPRSCIGKRIVDLELELGVARIIRNFHVEFNYSTENAFKSILINVPNIPLRFKFSDVKE